MISILISIVIVALFCGLIAFLIGRAPFINPDYKTIAQYIILVIFVIYVVSLLLPYIRSSVQ